MFRNYLLLVAGTLTVYTQISFMRNSDLGVNIKNVMVLGVLKNYHQEGLKEDQEPLLFRYFEDANYYYSIQVNRLKSQKVLAFVEEECATS